VSSTSTSVMFKHRLFTASDSYHMTANGGRTRRRICFHLRAVRPDLGAVRRDNAESRARHVDSDVVGGEVRTEPEVEPDVAASSSGVAVDRNEAVCVERLGGARPAFRRQMERHFYLQPSVLRQTRLHPVNVSNIQLFIFIHHYDRKTTRN